MIDLYGKSRAYIQFGEAGGPMQTVSVEVKATLRGEAGDSIFRLRVPGFGWRKLRYPSLQDIRAGNRLPYVLLANGERATVTA